MIRVIENDIKGIKLPYHELTPIEYNFTRKYTQDHVCVCQTCNNVIKDNILYNPMIDEIQCEECFDDFANANIKHSVENIKIMNWNYKNVVDSLKDSDLTD